MVSFTATRIWRKVHGLFTPAMLYFSEKGPLHHHQQVCAWALEMGEQEGAWGLGEAGRAKERGEVSPKSLGQYALMHTTPPHTKHTFCADPSPPVHTMGPARRMPSSPYCCPGRGWGTCSLACLGQRSAWHQSCLGGGGVREAFSKSDSMNITRAVFLLPHFSRFFPNLVAES